MIRVLLEQQVIPPYRVPFFAKLAKQVDLLLLASRNPSARDVNDITDDLPFPVVRSEELVYRYYHYHRDIFSCLRQHRAQVFISNYSVLIPLLIHEQFRHSLRETGARVLVWGCYGYNQRDFRVARRQYTLGYKLLRPRNWLLHPTTWSFLLRDPLALSVAGTDGFLAYSSLTAAYWQTAWGIPTSKITVAHNAIDTVPLLSRHRALPGAGVERVMGRIAFVGRMTQGKGLELLLRAYCKVKTVHRDASLMLVGDGSGRAPLEQLAAEMKLEGVEFKGEILDQRQLADELCRASLYVLPWLGGLGINTAMACGLPVVCSLADGTELDLVKEGRNGWFFAPGDEQDLARVMTAALSDAERLKRYGQESARLIEQVYNLDNMVQAFVDRINLVLR